MYDKSGEFKMSKSNRFRSGITEIRLTWIVAFTATLAAWSLHGGELSDGGYSIFDETVVDMPWTEVETAARDGAIVLWPLGVIEEHGPHLPLGVDIYNAYLRMKAAKRLLEADGVNAVIAPPLYWGINEVTGSFPGSFILRPSTLEAIIEDTFASLKKDGFRAVYLITGHGDQLHNVTIVEGVRAARAATGMRGYVVIDDRMRGRLGLTGDEAHVIVTPNAYGGAGSSPPKYIEVHAGAGETSTVWYYFPDLVRSELIAGLEPTRYGRKDLDEWRQGWDDARAKTPHGYFGDPAAAQPGRGKVSMERSAELLAKAVQEHLAKAPWAQADPP